MEKSDSGFAEALLAITRRIFDETTQGNWEAVSQLTSERAILIESPAAKIPPVPGSESIWREIDRLNREALDMAEAQLRTVGDTVQSVRNQQRLQQRYTP